MSRSSEIQRAKDAGLLRPRGGEDVVWSADCSRNGMTISIQHVERSHAAYASGHAA